MSIGERARQIVSLEHFAGANEAEEVGPYHLECPFDDQYILRMLVKVGNADFRIPSELEWLRDMIEEAYRYQREEVGVTHSFCYVTVRHGEVRSVTDDEWHVDGFSTFITHIPESNYVAVNHTPTEYLVQPIEFPDDFDPLVHNVQWYIQNRASLDVRRLKPHTLYCFDPYFIHRRPSIEPGTHRTFVRVSFTPIEIADDANTPNPLLPMRVYERDGVTIRNALSDYDLDS